MQNLNARRHFNRNQRDAGLQSLRAAYMLAPDRYARTFATELWKGPEQPGTLMAYAMMTEAMDIMQFKLQSYSPVFPIGLLGNWTPQRQSRNMLQRNLRGLPPDLDDAGFAVITTFRRRFREYMEWLVLDRDSVDKTALAWVQLFSPYFFNSLEEAIAYQQKLAQLGTLDPFVIQNTEILDAPQWDRETAEAMWIEFLLGQEGYSRYQGYFLRAHILLGRLRPSSGVDYTTRDFPPEGIQAACDLVAWLSKNPGYVTMSHPFYIGFFHMDPQFQREHLNELFVKPKKNLALASIFQLLYTVMEGILKQAPDDVALQAEMKAHLLAHLDLAASSVRRQGHYLDPPLPLLEHTEPHELAALPFYPRVRTRRYIVDNYPLVARLLPTPNIPDAPGSPPTEFVEWHIPQGYQHIFDYQEDVPENLRPQISHQYVDFTLHYTALVAASPDAFWCMIRGGLLLRIDAKTAKPTLFPFSFAEVMIGGGVEQIRLEAAKNYLVYAGRHQGLTSMAIWIIPLGGENREPQFHKAEKIKGLPPMTAFPHPSESHQTLTHMLALDDRIYMAFTPGMLYLWSPEMQEAKRILRYDDLIDGPLTDTNPYVIVDAMAGPSPSVTYFDVRSAHPAPVSGWYRYDPAEDPQWALLSNNPSYPRWRTVKRRHLEYLDQNGRITRVANVKTQVPDNPMAQNADAAFWLAYDRGKTFRIYRFDRQNWDDATKQSNEP